MDLDWTPPRTIAAATVLLNAHLPCDLAKLAADFLDDQRGLRTIQNASPRSRIRHIRIRAVEYHRENSNVRLPGTDEVDIVFVDHEYGVLMECSHCIKWANEDIWSFACGEDAPLLKKVLSLHTKDAVQVGKWMNEARRDLRRQITQSVSW
jgi:hypothetical protein